MSEVAPRLLNLTDAAQYIGVSYNTIVDYVKMELIPLVPLPARLADGGDKGKLRRNRLVDRSDLDELVERFKAEVEPQKVRGRR